MTRRHGGFFALTALHALALVAALVSTPQAQERRPGPAFDFDRRASADLMAAPSRSQTAAIAELRAELDGSLLESYDPSSGVTRSLFNPVGRLTGPSPGAPVDIALAFIQDNLELLGLEASDVDEIELCDTVYSTVSGATHVYFCQKHQDIPVYNAQLHVNVSADGSILSVNNSFVPGLKDRGKSRRASIAPEDAVLATANHLGATGVSARRQGAGPRVMAESLSSQPIDASLIWVPMGRSAQLAWRFQLETPDGRHVYDVTVDAEPGADPRDARRVLTRYDRVSPGLYQVYPMPQESPTHGADPDPVDGRQTVVNPEDPVASPLGWHDDGNNSYQIMRGNNVHAYDDLNADDLPPTQQPSCGPNLDCSFALDLTQDPSTYTSAAVANLFYWTNIVHDVQYQYGFDEAAGNFQVNNFGRGGLGGDAVRAEAQDGSGIDNANFTTSVDGVPPRIQMFLWDLTYPLRDGDLDAGIVIHEYGHGISTRLVGGPSTVSCLSNPQQPGEGLSDWWSLVYTARPEDKGTDPRGIGTYVLGEPPGGFGIRTQSYSTSPSINTHTYESIFGMAVPHGVGEVWAQAAWEAYWRLVTFRGFDSDLYNATGGAGNQRMMLYVNEGLKNTACSPTFTDVRDGILQAAIDNHGGEDVCLLWEAFAAFGLGEDAVSGGPFSTSPTNGFRIPAACLAGPRIVSPSPDSQLTGHTVDFEWTADGEAVDEWMLEIGSTLGGNDVYSSGSIPGATLTTTVSGIPVDERQLFVRLHYLVGTDWSYRDALYLADLATPEITDPAPGTTLTGSDVTFTWDSLGLPVTNWSLDIGSLPGQGNFFSTGTLDPTVLSVDATGIPTDGRTVYVRLGYVFNGAWLYVNASYTASDIIPTLTSPASGSTLAGSDVTFTWDSNGGLIDTWTLYVGSSPGSSNLFNSGNLAGDTSSVTVTGLPTNGSTLYVKLRYGFKNLWRSLDFTFTAADLAPALLSPTPGSVLPGSTVTFNWTSNGAPVQNWILEVGFAPGRSDYHYSGTLASNVLSSTATGIPTDNRAIYVRLRYLLNGTWGALNYEYTAANFVPALVSPVPGSVLPSSNVTFAWTSNGAPVTGWTLWVGTSAGLSNLYASGTLAATVLSVDATNLPTNGSPIFVRLRYLAGGTWSTLDYVYTAAAPPPIMTAPAPGSTLADTAQVFSWDDNGSTVTEWRLTVGTTVGAVDVFDSGPLAPATSAIEVTGLPTDGSMLYVRLGYTISGSPGYADFVYTATLREPAIASPAPGSTLSGPQATFTWAANGADVSEWQLLVGSSVGAGDFDTSGALPASTLSRTVSNLPTDGSDIHVRLEYVVNGNRSSKDYVYVAGVGVPELISPVPSSTLSGSDVTFTWTANAAPVQTWYLYVGSSVGSSGLYYSGALTGDVVSANVTGLPTDNRTLYVRLRYLLNGVWTNLDYVYAAADIVPELSSPAPGSVLSGSDVTFSWTSNGAAVSSWLLYVGSSPGSSNYHYSGSLASTVLSRDVTGLPTDSRTLYVRLRYLSSGTWKNLDYTYTAANLVPELLAPTPGTVLPSADVTFSWTSNGAPVKNWTLEIGFAVGRSDYYASGTLAANVLSANVSDLPIDSSPVYVRLRHLTSGVWSTLDYVYTAAAPPPIMTAPVPGSVLTDTTQTFTWDDNGSTVSDWRFTVGSAAGGSDVFDSGPLAAATSSVDVSGLPSDGRTLYVRLAYTIGGNPGYADFVYIATLREPDMVSPTPGTVLAGPDATFTWATNGADVSEWQLLVGNSLGAGDLHTSGPLAAATLSHGVTGLPTDGRDIHVRLEYVVNGTRSSKDYVYTAGVGVPALVSPLPGSTLSGPDVTFTWTANAAPVQSWYLYVGTSVGSSSYHYSGALGAGVLSRDVSGLPTDGRTIYVRLRFLLNGTWQNADYVYTAANLVPELTSPTPGSVLSGSNVTFSWATNGAPITSWTLYVGSSPGSSNYYYSGTLASTVLSRDVTGLPTDSRALYVRLRYLSSGTWKSLDYIYTAANLVPELLTPTPGSVLPGADVTFTWTSNGAPVSQWTLEVGTGPGLSNLFYSGSLASGTTSAFVSGLPTNGSTIYVRLRYYANGSWKSVSHEVVAAGGTL